MASVRKASSRAGPNMSQSWGKSGSGNSMPARIRQLDLSPCYSIREWPGVWSFSTFVSVKIACQ